MILDSGPGGPSELVLAERPQEVRALAERCARAEAIALDVAADGLFVFRAKLCTLQLAFREGGDLVVGVIDTLATGIGPLVDVLSEAGPVKVLHDLTFDARLLEESAAPLGRVRDTSVSARLLGYKEGGLAALLRIELGLDLDKKHQQHDWSRRPLLPEQIRYLADDVRYLLTLDERFASMADEVGIAEEIAEECSYKLASARRPPRDLRPPYVRIKGAHALDAVGRAVLRRLCEARDAAAEKADVPPFKMTGNELLVDLARKRPASAGAFKSIVGSRGASSWADALLEAIAAGVRDGDVPPDHRAYFEPVRLDRAAIAKRKALEVRVSAWRRAEAKRRGVDEQAVLPGHCAQDLVSVLLGADVALDAADLRSAVARIPGLGARRMERYGEALLAFSEPVSEPPAEPPAEPPVEPPVEPPCDPGA